MGAERMSGTGPKPRGQPYPSPLWDFPRRELAPTPGRLGAPLRLTLACTAATVPIMIHHIPHGLVVMIVMYLITKEDTTATVLGSVLAVLGVTLGFALALLAWQVALETAWRLVSLGVQLLLSPGDPLALLRRALGERFEAVEECVRRLLGRRCSGGPRSSLPSLTVLTIAGSSEMLTLLQMASLRHAWARRHRPELGALIGLVDQLVTAAAALESTEPPAIDTDARERLDPVAGAGSAPSPPPPARAAPAPRARNPAHAR